MIKFRRRKQSALPPETPEFIKRQGQFEMGKTDVIDTLKLVSRILVGLRFVPTSVTWSMDDDCWIYVGYSPHFEVRQFEFEMPKYQIMVADALSDPPKFGIQRLEDQVIEVVQPHQVKDVLN